MSSVPAIATATPIAEAGEPVPNFSRPDRVAAPSPNHRWEWTALAVLVLLLGLQLLLADRERLAAQAGWRPLLGTVCGVFRCELPPWREPQAFAMLSRDIRPLPDTPGTLMVQATFRNDARWPQPWPTLQLSLSDADGRLLGARAFAAAEYLDPTVTQSELAPGQSAQISMRLREPSADVVAFSFDFR